ncbi:hypothetical protein V6N11_026740 [Hibiscus sabdariffa]|uniref:Uncharacterized protein n=1 Tax=Hibiscus sabdariffa TaxID=183260 RepID=A0ABR2SXE6_9ROSI
MKTVLLQLVKPSGHCIQRRRNLEPMPSRFCLLNGNSNRKAKSPILLWWAKGPQKQVEVKAPFINAPKGESTLNGFPNDC